MSESDSIPRSTNKADELDFFNLRQQGITYAQELSGNVWTDYNLHDPGVTILEQLCFGLTELAYQTDIPVADFLANEKGQINYHDVGLLKPHEVLPVAPVTPDDYCKLLVDAIPEIDRIEFSPIDSEGENAVALYKIIVTLLEPYTGQPFSLEQKATIRQSIKAIYGQNRNLCEDLADIIIKESKPCFLAGVVETDGFRHASEIYADIFFQCARKISSSIHIERYEDIFARDPDLGKIFTGPLTRHGSIVSENFSITNAARSMRELDGAVAKIDGVRKVYELKLVDDAGELLSEEKLASDYFFLKFPDENQPVLTINFNPGKTADSEDVVNLSENITRKILTSARRHLQKLEFEYRAFRNSKANNYAFYDLPGANPTRVEEYYSIQHQFPNVYGINAAGLPPGESIERINSARQLKAYLFPFEQLMANYLQMLQHLPQLFSINGVTQRTYFSAYLNDAHIPAIENLYQHKVIAFQSAQSEELHTAQKIVSDYDNLWDRKNRAIDTLLALYGESFSQQALLHFTSYHSVEAAAWVLNNKIHYLRNIQELSSRRFCAANLQAEQWNTDNMSVLQKKISILLGIGNYSRTQSLVNVFDKNNIGYVNDGILLKNKNSVKADDITGSPVPVMDEQQAAHLQHWQRDPVTKIILSDSMLRYGGCLDYYRIVRENKKENVYFYFHEQQRYLLLRQCDTIEKATAYVHKFIKIINSLNEETEGMFIIEHLLLRARSQPFQDYFFSAQLTIVLPDWTARFSDPAFRQYSQKLICNNLPAHLLPHFYWLDISSMKSFEVLYKRWLGALLDYEQKNGVDESVVETLDRTSDELKSWLLQQQSSSDYWV